MLILNSAENTEAAVVAVTYVEEIRPFADEIQILTKSRIYKITGVADVDVTRAALQAIIWPTI